MIIIREARSDDAMAVCTILRRSIAELCSADHHKDPHILDEWLANKTEANMRERISSDEQTYRLAIIDGEIAGVGAAMPDGHILLNYVSPDYQYRGVSKAVMDALENWLRECGQHQSILHSTTTACEFYISIGYRANGEKETGKTGLVSFPLIKDL